MQRDLVYKLSGGSFIINFLIDIGHERPSRVIQSILFVG